MTRSVFLSDFGARAVSEKASWVPLTHRAGLENPAGREWIV